MHPKAETLSSKWGWYKASTKSLLLQHSVGCCITLVGEAMCYCHRLRSEHSYLKPLIDAIDALVLIDTSPVPPATTCDFKTRAHFED